MSPTHPKLMSKVVVTIEYWSEPNTSSWSGHQHHFYCPETDCNKVIPIEYWQRTDGDLDSVFRAEMAQFGRAQILILAERIGRP